MINILLLIILVVITTITTATTQALFTPTPATFDLAGSFQTVDDVAPFCSPASCFRSNENPLAVAAGKDLCKCPSGATQSSFRLLVENCAPNYPNSLHGGFFSVCTYNTFNNSSTTTAGGEDSSRIFGGAFQMDDEVPFKSTGCRVPNPITGACTCPTTGGFSSTVFNVLADCEGRGCSINTKVTFCVNKKPSSSSSAPPKNIMFAGAYLVSQKEQSCLTGNVLSDNNNNACSCPSWASPSLTTNISIVTTNNVPALIMMCQASPSSSSLPSPPSQSQAPPFQLYVAAGGSDNSNNGTSPSSPFATLTQTLTTIENMRDSSPDVYGPRKFIINLMVNDDNNSINQNIFFHNDTILVSPKAAGSVRLGSSLTIRSYSSSSASSQNNNNNTTKKAIISGGEKLIQPSSWKPSSKQHPGIFELQLPQGTPMVWGMWEINDDASSSSSISQRVLLHQTETVQYKQYDTKSNVMTLLPGVPPLPNSSSSSQQQQQQFHHHHRKSNNNKVMMKSLLHPSSSSSSSSINNNPLADAYVYIYHSWTSTLSAVQKYSPEQNEIVVAGTVSDNKFNSASGNRFRLANILNDEERMKPGSFVFDKTTFILKYRPTSVSSTTGLPSRPVVIPTKITTVLQTMQGAENINIENVEFAHTASNLDAVCIRAGCAGQSASVLENPTLDLQSSHTTISDCNIRHTGQHAVWIRYGPFVNVVKSSSSSSSSSIIEDLGAGGIRVGTPSVHAYSSSVSDVTIRYGGFTVEQGCGILAQKVAFFTATHNLIHDMKYSAVSVGWDWSYGETGNTNNLISWNKMYNIMLGILSDGGCVYTLGFNWGSRIENNLCHDVQSYGYGGWGYYLDQATTGIIWSSNIAYRTKAAAFHVHFGLYNLITNNILAFPQQYDIGRGVSQGDFAGLRSSPSSSGFESITQFNFIKNIILQRNSTSTLFYRTTLVAFKNTTFEGNVYFNTGKSISDLDFPTPGSGSCVSWDCWKRAGKDSVNSSVANPEFVGDVSDSYDFSKLMSSSPALAAGFIPINQGAIGPRS